MPTTIVTTSWDDGHHTDLRLADRLAAHALKGTFYVALNHPGKKDIGDDEIRALRRMGMEIGSHTLTHRLLTGRSVDEVRYELTESKARLEDITGAPVVAFSYPEGAFTATACAALAETGYALGRTTIAFRTPTRFDPARMPISIDFRRAGIASELMGRAADWFAANAKSPAVYLWVIEQNTGARRFYLIQTCH